LYVQPGTVGVGEVAVFGHNDFLTDGFYHCFCFAKLKTLIPLLEFMEMNASRHGMGWILIKRYSRSFNLQPSPRR
jgi:hypothetical protein